MAKINNNQVEENAQESQVEVTETKTVRSAKATKESKKASKPAKAEKAQKKSKIKETFGELKKVTWPSFGKAMKQTGSVLTIVLLFGIVVLGIDLLISFIINLLSSF